MESSNTAVSAALRKRDPTKKSSVRRRGRGSSSSAGSSNNPPSDITSYISFGLVGRLCLGIFLVTYLVSLTCLLPMLDETSTNEQRQRQQQQLQQQQHGGEGGLRQGGAFEGAYIHLPHVPAAAGKERLVQAASAMKDKLVMMTGGTGIREKQLLDAAKKEFEVERAKQADKKIGRPPGGGSVSEQHGDGRFGFRKAVFKEADNSLTTSMEDKTKEKPVTADQHDKERNGFVVLGMHRSGTSMLSGLLVTGMGYNVGKPLIGAAFDNEKGFFELIPVVLQNDEFMKAQNIWWAANVIQYDSNKALEHKKNGRITFQEGTRGLEFLNNKSNAPWLQKDPRMCITLPTWLRLLNSEPAVVFTYRHPLEVAMSLKKRENFPLEKGLRLWIVYNMRAVQNSANLCRVLSSNTAILDNPLSEVQRIADDLTTKCGVPAPPHRLKQEIVDSFVDPNLQHNHKKRRKEEEEGGALPKVLSSYGDCVIRDYPSEYPEGSSLRKQEADTYVRAMKVYCDLESGKAYMKDYDWSSLWPPR